MPRIMASLNSSPHRVEFQLLKPICGVGAISAALAGVWDCAWAAPAVHRNTTNGIARTAGERGALGMRISPFNRETTSQLWRNLSQWAWKVRPVVLLYS